MAKLVSPPPKFTQDEWTVSNLTKYHTAEAERSRSERLIAESQRLMNETEQTTRRTQRDVNKKLEQRIDDVDFWKSELDRKLEEITNETDTMLEYKTRLEKGIEACEEPLRIAQTCLANRQNRASIDLVHDDVERQLLKEVETIQGVMELLMRTHEQAVEQIRLNRSAKFHLEKDLRDKLSALNIDDFCSTLTNNTPDIGYAGSAVKIQANSVTPQDWRSFSDDNIAKADKQKNLSIQLRSLIDGVLVQTADDMQKQVDATNLAFRKRVDETKLAKSKLEDHLGKVMDEVTSQEKNNASLRKAINDKEAPMQVAQTRLGNREQRPNVELCRDPVQYRLVGEVGEISENVQRLQELLYASDSELKGLRRNQLILEEDIEVKANSLHIDEVQCMQLREGINIKSF
ncbi:tektin-1-like isoform X1 [Branchiostoma lanceolatum]|uniref:tektin-1-like isoform X1 n=2 Tax=Branchiostoma lanceolatum TaxID=7740 RepID=UPI003452B423